MGESTSSDLLQAAIQEIKTGNIASGQQTLRKVIKTDPHSVYAEKAWIWMSATFSDSDRKRRCLENALKTNPDNEIAQKGLAKLPPPTPPQKVEETTEFEYPEWLSDNPNERLNTPSTLEKIQSSNDMVQNTVQPRRKSDQQLIDEYIAKQTAKGWQIVSYTATSVQLRKPKQWSKVGLILGFILFASGIGIIVLLLTLVDYLLKKDKVAFVDAEELRTTGNLTESPSKIKSNNRSLTPKLLLTFITIFCVLFLCSLISIGSLTSSNQTSSSSGYSVTYRITGAENRASVLSGNSANNQPITVQLPWQHTISMKYGDTAALIATGETNKTVKCEIFVNGKLRTSATSSAAMDNMAVCGYVVGRNVPINVVP